MAYTIDTKNEEFWNSCSEQEQKQMAIDLCTGAAIPLDNKPAMVIEEENYETLPDVVPPFKLF